MAEVGRIEGLYGETLANHKVTLFKTRAVLTGPNSIRLTDGQTVTAGKILSSPGAPARSARYPWDRTCHYLERRVSS
jgi:glutathione reductase (NADPH)